MSGQAPHKKGEGGTCSSVSPHLLCTTPPTDAGWGNILYSFSCCFCHSLSPHPTSSSLLWWVQLELSHTWVLGWGWAQEAQGSTGSTWQSCRILSLAAEHVLTSRPSLFSFLLYIATLFWPFCFVHLSSWFCSAGEAQSFCVLLDWFLSHSSPLPTHSHVLNQLHWWKSGVSLLHYMINGNL